MKDPAPPVTIGYMMVAMPSKGSWQGFFVTPEFDAMAAGGMESLRAAIGGSAVRASASPAPETIAAMDDVAPEDQVFVGGLSAAICDLYNSNQRENVERRLRSARNTAEQRTVETETRANVIRLGTLAAMLRRVIGKDHFLVVGYEEQGGWRTTVECVIADSLDDAREKLMARARLRLDALRMR